MAVARPPTVVAIPALKRLRIVAMVGTNLQACAVNAWTSPRKVEVELLSVLQLAKPMLRAATLTSSILRIFRTP
jgi:hypothetical protein